MGRVSPRRSHVVHGMNKGAWAPYEDETLIDYVKSHGEGKWSKISTITGLKRCGKSCRLRWKNYLRPDIKRGNISVDEEELIVRLHKLLGNRWSLIAGRLPGRTDNEIKNYWNTNLGKKIEKQRKSASSSLKVQSKSDAKFMNMTSFITGLPSNQAPDTNIPPPTSAVGGGVDVQRQFAPTQPQVPESNDLSSSQNFMIHFNIDDIGPILDIDDVILANLNLINDCSINEDGETRGW